MGAPDRLTRINELIKRQLADSFERRLTDIGSGMLISVTEVNTSVDLRNATVYVSIFGGDDAARHRVLRELEKRRSDLQKDLARHLAFKYTPVLTFRPDERLERGDRVLELLNRTEAENDEAN